MYSSLLREKLLPLQMPVCFLIFHGPALYLAQKDTLEAMTLIITLNIHRDKAKGTSFLSQQANYDLSVLPRSGFLEGRGGRWE